MKGGHSEAKRNERARNRNKTQKSLVSLSLPGSLTPRAPSPLTGSLTPQAPSLLMAPHPSGSLPAHRLRAISLRALSPLLGVSPSGLPPCSWVSLPHGSLPTPRGLSLWAPSLLVGLSPSWLPPHSWLTHPSPSPHASGGCSLAEKAARIRAGGMGNVNGTAHQWMGCKGRRALRQLARMSLCCCGDARREKLRGLYSTEKTYTP